MSNQSWPGVSSLVLNEPLLWEKGRPGRVGVSLPESDVPAAPTRAFPRGTSVWTRACIRSVPAP